MRSSRTRLIAVALVGVLASVGLGACGERVDDRDRLLTALRRTKAMARTFAYREEASDKRITIEGVVEDDFRYAGRLSLDGQPLFEQVVADDSLGLRMLSPAALPDSTLTGTPTADDALRNQGWVLDPTGAPPLTSAKKRTGPVAGRDIVADAYRYLTSVEAAVNEAAEVRRYSDDSIFYKPSEDPFPTPKDDDGVIRYDMERPRLPRASDLGGGASAGENLPAERHFRKLSVYVRDGLVEKVLERVAFDEKLDDALEFFEGGLSAQETPPPEVVAFIERARDDIGAGRQAEVEEAVLAALNVSRSAFGEDPVLLRNVEMTFRDLGSSRSVDIPADRVEASLTAFFKAVEEEVAGGATGAGTEVTTTTTAPPGG